jgi:hypothetical protein
MLYTSLVTRLLGIVSDVRAERATPVKQCTRGHTSTAMHMAPAQYLLRRSQNM